MAGLKAALDELHRAGCRTVYINGSFVTSKESPGDYDGCWDATGVDRRMLDPIFLDYDEDTEIQKVKYRGEMYPNTPSNYYLDFFQRDIDGNPKGIIALDLKGWK